MRTQLMPILLFSSMITAFAQQCPQGCQSQITALTNDVQQLKQQAQKLQLQVPISAQWPTASEAGTNPRPFQDPVSKSEKTFKELPYDPHFALVSWIAIRQRGSGVGDSDVKTPVLIVPAGSTQTVGFPDQLGCSGMKITLTGKTLTLEHNCRNLMYGGYPAFNIEFLP